MKDEKGGQMSLIKGSINLTRYKVIENIDTPDIDIDYIQKQLQSFRFQSIDETLDAESVGWVETLDSLSTEFSPTIFNFGECYTMGMRVDTRNVSTKMFKRYVAIAIAKEEERAGRPLSADERGSRKNFVYAGLMNKAPVDTDVFGVCWFQKRAEVWLAGTGTRTRERFEALWQKTFGTGLLLKIPYVSARDMISQDGLERISPTSFTAGRRF
jgi:hypothetical protein